MRENRDGRVLVIVCLRHAMPNHPAGKPSKRAVERTSEAVVSCPAAKKVCGQGGREPRADGAFRQSDSPN